MTDDRQSSNLRQARRSQWAREVQDGKIADVGRTFEAAGTPAPTIAWSPVAEQLKSKPNRFLLEYWLRLNSGHPPHVDRLDPIDLKPALGYINLVEPVDDGRDFQYRVYGSLIATVSGRDLNRQLMSDIDASDFVVDLSIACSRAVLARCEPLLERRVPSNAVETAYWERLLLPFKGDQGHIERLLIGSVPVGRHGEPIRPAM